MKELEDQLWRVYWKEIKIIDENATEKIELMENDVIDGNFTAADPLMTKVGKKHIVVNLEYYLMVYFVVM